jgi:hypothetical protein
MSSASIRNANDHANTSKLALGQAKELILDDSGTLPLLNISIAHALLAIHYDLMSLVDKR